MRFNSYEFALFFAGLFLAYWLLGKWPRLQNIVLLAAGYYFYACWNPKFLALLVVSTVMDYGCGLWVDRAREHHEAPGRCRALDGAQPGDARLLQVLQFLRRELAGRARLEPACRFRLRHLEVVLPIGISFYTFQSMSYVIDVYRREIKPTRNLVQFAVFVSFFPHLVAGPIMRPTTLLPQVASRRRFNLQQFYEGVYLIFWGLVEKVVVADNLAVVVNDLFGRWEALDGGLALVAIYAFAFQIYGDFSGYTNMARGVAKCLGFELPLNFNLPYFATSPRDFWNRWHISLSQWLRDYLYIPLGGSRGGTLLTYRNVMLTMVLGGLWHGAKWTFVVWGLYHGAVAGRAPTGGAMARANRAGRSRWIVRAGPDCECVVTFHLVCLGWLIFRAIRMEQAAGMLAAIVQRPAIPAAAYLVPVALTIIPLLLVQFVQYVADDLDVIGRTPWYVRSVFYTACFYAIVLVGQFGGQQFIYFQF